MRYSVLLFDLDETLLDFHADMHEAFFAMCCKQGIDIDETHYASFREINQSWWSKFEKGLCTKAELFTNRFTEWIEHHEIAGDPAILATAIFDELGKQARLFPGAYEMVETLAKTHQICYVTNGNASSQHERIALCGLGKFGSKTFVSEDAGAAKPHQAYFDYVFARLEAEKKDCLLIGDSLAADIAGALGYGIDCIWYNPSGMKNASDLHPTYEARTYQDILNLLL